MNVKWRDFYLVYEYFSHIAIPPHPSKLHVDKELSRWLCQRLDLIAFTIFFNFVAGFCYQRLTNKLVVMKKESESRIELRAKSLWSSIDA